MANTLSDVDKLPYLEMLREVQEDKLLGSGMDTVTEWEYNFMKDQIKRFTEWGSDMFISEKQAARIKDIYEQLTED